ncbi:transmembrane protein, putative, partial [Rhizoctonia solani AG-3 Rhs1AP]
MSAPPPEYTNPSIEEQIRTELQALQTLFDERTDARSRGDTARVARIEARIAQTMRRVGDAYPNEETRQHWYRQAENFEKATPEQREHILMPIAKGLGILIAAPLALAFGIVGGAVFAAGSILYGAGKVVMGLGTLLTGGWLR